MFPKYLLLENLFTADTALALPSTGLVILDSEQCYTYDHIESLIESGLRQPYARTIRTGVYTFTPIFGESYVFCTRHKYIELKDGAIYMNTAYSPIIHRAPRWIDVLEDPNLPLLPILLKITSEAEEERYFDFTTTMKRKYSFQLKITEPQHISDEYLTMFKLQQSLRAVE